MSYYGIKDFDPENLHRRVRPDPDYGFRELLFGFFAAIVSIIIVALAIGYLFWFKG